MQVPGTILEGEADIYFAKLECNNNARDEIAFALTSTAPLYGGSGQDIYYSDLYPTVVVPLFYNTTQYATNVSIDFILANAAQSSVNLAGPATISHSGEASLNGDVSVPGLVAGPVTLGTAGVHHTFTLGDVNITIENVVTNEVSTYICPAAAAPDAAILGSVVVDSSSGAPLAPSTGTNTGYPIVPPGQKGTVASVPLTCQAGITSSNPQTFNVSLSGVVPLIPEAGSNFTITSEENFITIPNDIVRAFAGFDGNDQTQIGLGLGQSAPGVASGQPGFGLAISNAAPDFLDLAFNFTASDANDTPKPWSGSYKVESNTTSPLTLGFPLDGSLTIGPFTAGTSGSVFGIGITGLSGAIASPDVGQTLFSCSLDSGVELFSTVVV